MNKALQRVLKDLKETQNEPIPGVSLFMPDIENPFTLHGNIEIKDGIYEGCLIHLIIHIPKEYPIQPPAVNIAPGLKFGHRFHEHIFDVEAHGNSICTDLTSNFMGHFQAIDSAGRPTQSGWTPAYTLSSVLLQLQVFFADPDLPVHMLPSEKDIEDLKEHIKNYKLDIKINNGSETSVVTHSWEKPYPSLAQSVKKGLPEKIEDSPVSTPSTTSTMSPMSSGKNETEEVKENVEVKAVVEKKNKIIVSQWDKPLKKVVKGSVNPETTGHVTQTIIVKVVKKSAEPSIEQKKEEEDSKQELTRKKGQRRGLYNQYNNRNNNYSNNHWNRNYDGYRERNYENQNERNWGSYRSNNNNQYEDTRKFYEQRKTVTPKPESTRKVVEEEKVQENQSLHASKWGVGLKKFSKTNAASPKLNQTQFVVVSQHGTVTKKIQEETFSKTSFFTQQFNYKSLLSADSGKKNSIGFDVKDRLKCSVMKTDLFDESKPILGYPIDLTKDAFGRLWPTPIMEVLSYDAFAFNIQQNFEKLDRYQSVKFTSSMGASYNYWLPVYIDDDHFKRGKEHILNAIAIIFAGVEGKRENDFHHSMVLKVLPPILVKTAIHFLKGTIYQSYTGIDVYCQIYRLLIKLVEMFPEIRKDINQQVKSFCAGDHNRSKKALGDLGEFIIKLCLSDKGVSDPEIMHYLVKEHLTRQVSWALKKDRSLNYRNENSSDFVQRFMKAADVSNQFFLVQLETARLLLNKDVQVEMDQKCGLLSEEILKAFKGRLTAIQNHMTDDWRVYVEGTRQKENIYSEEIMHSYILDAFDSARRKGYL